jgi:hypothetical protein
VAASLDDSALTLRGTARAGAGLKALAKSDSMQAAIETETAILRTSRPASAVEAADRAPCVQLEAEYVKGAGRVD